MKVIVLGVQGGEDTNTPGVNMYGMALLPVEGGMTMTGHTKVLSSAQPSLRGIIYRPSRGNHGGR